MKTMIHRTMFVSMFALLGIAGCSSGSKGGGAPALPVIHSLSIQGLPAHPGNTVTATVNASSPASLALTYTWTVSGTWSVGSGANTSTAILTAPNAYSAGGSVTVIVSDTRGGFVTGTSSLSTQGNSAPVIHNLAVSANPVFTGSTITATAGASDPDGDTPAYTWAASTGWAVTGYGATATVTAPSVHSAAGNITVTVSDGYGASASSSIAIDTTSDSAPVITSMTISPQPVTTTASLVSSAYAPDGDSLLTYTWNIGGTNITTGSSAIWQSPGISGNYNAVVSVSDVYGSTATQGSSISVTSQSPWPKFRNNLQSTGLSAISATPTTRALEWSFTTGSSVDPSPAIGADGAIYVGNGNGYLYALNVTNGTLLWNYSVGGYLYSSPAIGADGTIYVGMGYDLYAINPNGTKKWNYATGNMVDSSPVIGADGTIYVGSWDAHLYAINPDGGMKWSYTTGGRVNSSPAIAPDGTIYVGSQDDHLYAINPDGGMKWSYTTGNLIDFSSPAIGADGTIYIGAFDRKLYAINPDGTFKWSYTTPGDIESSPAIGADGTIYVGFGYVGPGGLCAIDPNGGFKWSYTTSQWISDAPAIGSDGTIYVGSVNDYLYAINPNGGLNWSYTTGNPIYSSPAIGADGTIYVGSDDGHLYAFH